MRSIESRIENLDWKTATDNLNKNGYTLLKSVLTHEESEMFVANYQSEELYRKTISMKRYRFGQGEYKYFRYPLPDLISELRALTYAKICPIANHWMKILKIGQNYPKSFPEFQRLNHEDGQTKPTTLILRYEDGGYNTLHQDLYGQIFFPFQMVMFLNEPGVDFAGGEFVLTEQIPRAQSRAIVLQPQKGDILIFTTNFRPVRGAKGYYRANMKHGVSTVHSGVRHTLGIIYHDALA